MQTILYSKLLPQQVYHDYKTLLPKEFQKEHFKYSRGLSHEFSPKSVGYQPQVKE